MYHPTDPPGWSAVATLPGICRRHRRGTSRELGRRSQLIGWPLSIGAAARRRSDRREKLSLISDIAWDSRLVRGQACLRASLLVSLSNKVWLVSPRGYVLCWESRSLANCTCINHTDVLETGIREHWVLIR
jgi:hypothetical protein